MHRAIIKTKKGFKEFYFSHTRHSDELKVTALCVGKCGNETLYVRDENIVEIQYDPSIKESQDF